MIHEQRLGRKHLVPKSNLLARWIYCRIILVHYHRTFFPFPFLALPWRGGRGNSKVTCMQSSLLSNLSLRDFCLN
uniref:Uncharacterized protein n=1 Tax=Rhizophora mucronata TaxID=61149 RepID=A0A2P2IK16_RHIMU